MKNDAGKLAAAEAALDAIDLEGVIGIGTGSTANYFIDLLAEYKHQFDAAVASSIASATRLKACGIPVVELNGVGTLTVYVDGADEVNHHKQLLKGGGGALTREKIIANASAKFICIVDRSKLVDRLGTFPLPIEVIPMARSFVSREIVKLGGQPEFRHGFTTDNDNQIIDVYQLLIREPVALEAEINQIPGVVSNGLFARRGADIVFIGDSHGVESLA